VPLSASAVAEVIGYILPGVLCNDSTLLVTSDRATSPASSPSKRSPAASPGDIELGALGQTGASSPQGAKKDDGKGYEVEGDPTERCILELAVALQQAPQATKQLLSRNARLQEIPFDSATKYMATLHALTPDLAATLASAGKEVNIANATGEGVFASLNSAIAVF
jgi:magnesium-transporting ATPase (P-type)